MIVSIWMIYQQISDFFIKEDIYFGYEISLGWQILMITFWIFWLLGGIMLFLKRRLSYILLLPVSIISAIAVLFSVDHIIYEDRSTQFINFGGLLISVFLIVYMNINSTRSKFRIKRKHILLSFLILLIFSSLFFIIDKRQIM
jgi:hypothetical protein